MREIKFRAWDKINNKMVNYGNGDYREWCIRTDGFFGWVSKYGYIQNGEREFIPLQYTGLKDKNGVEIYEGDIVKVHDNDAWINPKKPENMGVVEYKDGCYHVAKTYIEYNVGCWMHAIEIIGNIYEDPELMEA